MSARDESTMTFQASTGQAVKALQEAARRSGMQHSLPIAATGVFVFTAGRMVLPPGGEHRPRRKVAPGVVQVTCPRDCSSV